MPAPTLTVDEVAKLVRNAKQIGAPCRGGQKQVFPCVIDGTRYALKFLLTDPASASTTDADGNSIEPLDEVLARARREIAIMERCSSPNLVKLGPVGLTKCDVNGQRLVYFTEEWIEGEDLKSVLAGGTMSIDDVVRLAVQVTRAIEELWTLRKVHRDIKPGNIVRRTNGDFVLLDLGLAFDLDDESLSGLGMVPGTALYLSPEQLDVAKKRSLDFRSDLFALGIVMYQALTGSHPFYSAGMSSHQALLAMMTTAVEAPSKRRTDVPAWLDDVVTRLLAKRPHLRYRRCSDLQDALAAGSAKGGV